MPMLRWMNIFKYGHISLILMLITACSVKNTPRRFPSSTLEVTSLIDLRQSLLEAREGDIIKIDSKLKFDMSLEKPLFIPAGVSLISGYSGTGKPGAHFYTTKPLLPMMKVMGDNVVISGLRIEGPDKETRQLEIQERTRTLGSRATYAFPISRGIEVKGNHFTIENCELWGWAHAAIYLGDGVENALITQNYIHHNQRHGLGYGVVLDKKSQALITKNIFDYNRHSIAGSGHSGQSYEASFNYFGPHHTQTPLDMHGGKDRGEQNQIAGHTVHIHHNKITSRNVSIFLHRGIPENKIIIEENQIPYLRWIKTVSYTNGLNESVYPASKFVFRNNRYFNPD